MQVTRSAKTLFGKSEREIQRIRKKELEEGFALRWSRTLPDYDPLEDKNFEAMMLSPVHKRHMVDTGFINQDGSRAPYVQNRHMFFASGQQLSWVRRNEDLRVDTVEWKRNMDKLSGQRERELNDKRTEIIFRKVERRKERQRALQAVREENLARRGSVRIRARVYDRPWRVNASPSPSPSSPLHGPPKGSDPEEMESCLLQSFLGSDAARALRSTRSGESRPGGRVDGKSSLLSERKESFSVSELQNDGNLLIRAGSAVLKSQQSAQQEDKDPQKGQRIGNTLTVLANATKGGLR